MPPPDPPSLPRARALAFETQVLPEVDVLARVARSLTRSSADAEDLVQDTLLRAFRSIDTFDGRYPRAWLLTIMRNANINHGRKKRPHLLDDPQATERIDPLAPPNDAENAYVSTTFDAKIDEAFAELSADFRQIVELVDLDGLSYQEAADVLGVPVGTVMSRLHRARKRIRESLTTADIESRREPA